MKSVGFTALTTLSRQLFELMATYHSWYTSHLTLCSNPWIYILAFYPPNSLMR
jgi:hypothetical protein